MVLFDVQSPRSGRRTKKTNCENVQLVDVSIVILCVNKYEGQSENANLCQRYAIFVVFARCQH